MNESLESSPTEGLKAQACKRKGGGADEKRERGSNSQAVKLAANKDASNQTGLNASGNNSKGTNSKLTQRMDFAVEQRSKYLQIENGNGVE